jgi:hypothetical protein
MAKFTIVKEKDAPKPIRQSGSLAHRMREYERYVDSVADGSVGRLTPADGETPRSIALRVSRAAKRMDRPIDTWIVDNIVYFKRRGE